MLAPSEPRDRLSLLGTPSPWSRPEWLVLFGLVAVAFGLRVVGLSAEGFADDEVHKWLAANRYLSLDIVGDDIEHPMLMKWLITLSLLVGERLGWAPETIVRLPNVFAGTASVVVVALLGRRLFGKLPGLVAAALVAIAPTSVGYHRVAKEDTLLGLFLMLVLLLFAEAKAAADDGRDRDRVRAEWLAAGALGLEFASKYFFFFALIPVLLYAWLRGTTDTRYVVPVRRWAQLIVGAVAVFAAVNWTPFMPSSWEYGLQYMAEQKTIHGSLPFMGSIHHNLPSWGLKGTPPWFYVVFAAIKLAPPTVLAAAVGLYFTLRERRPAHLVLLSWMAVWFLVFSVSGAKWGRFFTTILPAFALLAGHAVDRALEGLAALRAERRAGLLAPLGATAAAALLVGPLVGAEAWASVTHAPHYRLYVSALGGGDANIDYFFPHCDYFDTGFREAVAHVAKAAEKGAELSTEIDWVSKYYAGVYQRPDLVQTLMRKGEACKDASVCYVVVQSGRRYFLNEEALAYLEQKEPWYVERIAGRDVVKVYRLTRGDMPFSADRLEYAARAAAKAAQVEAPAARAEAPADQVAQ